jgi:hypothetical protein
MSERVAGNPREASEAPTGFHIHLYRSPLGRGRALEAGPTTGGTWYTARAAGGPLVIDSRWPEGAGGAGTTTGEGSGSRSGAAAGGASEDDDADEAGEGRQTGAHIGATDPAALAGETPGRNEEGEG